MKEPSSLASKRLAMVGVSHKAASVELRERLHVGPQLSREIGFRLAGRDGEAVVVSTCNRTELYLAAADISVATTLALDELVELAGPAVTIGSLPASWSSR